MKFLMKNSLKSIQKTVNARHAQKRNLKKNDFRFLETLLHLLNGYNYKSYNFCVNGNLK